MKFRYRHSLITLLLLGTSIGLYLLQLAMGVDSLSPSAYEQRQWGANIFALSLNGEGWRLLSSVFLHIGVIHLVVNMFVLWMGGPVVERYFGRLNFLVIYLVSGLCGSLLSAVWAARPPANLGYSAGASGALMGAVGACLAVRLLQASGAKVPPMMGPVLRTIAILVAADVVMGMMVPFINNTAHLGGLLSGAVLGALFALIARRPARPWISSVAMMLLVASVALCLSGFFDRLSTPQMTRLAKELRMRTAVDGGSGPWK